MRESALSDLPSSFSSKAILKKNSNENRLRYYGIGVQILKQLNVKKMNLVSTKPFPVGLIFFKREVPLSVPSLFHISRPFKPSSAVKYTYSLKIKKSHGELLFEPIFMSFN